MLAAMNDKTVLPPSNMNDRRAASAMLLLARGLGAEVESGLRDVLAVCRPDIKIGPTDPPDPT